jgi:hypothetical protein
MEVKEMTNTWYLETQGFEKNSLLNEVVLYLHDAKLSRTQGVPKIIGVLSTLPERSQLEEDLELLLEEYNKFSHNSLERKDISTWLFGGNWPVVVPRGRHFQVYPVVLDNGIASKMYDLLEDLGFCVSIPKVGGKSEHPLFASPKRLSIASDGTFTYVVDPKARSPLEDYPGYITYDQFLSL